MGHQHHSALFEAETEHTHHAGGAVCPGAERDRPRRQLRSLPPLCVMNVITLAAPACTLWMALVIYREPRAIGHPSFASALVAMCAWLAFVLFVFLSFVKARLSKREPKEMTSPGRRRRPASATGWGRAQKQRVYFHKAVMGKKTGKKNKQANKK